MSKCSSKNRQIISNRNMVEIMYICNKSISILIMKSTFPKVIFSLVLFLFLSRVNSSPSSEASSPFGPTQEKLVSPQTSRSVSYLHSSTFTCRHVTLLLVQS